MSNEHLVFAFNFTETVILLVPGTLHAPNPVCPMGVTCQEGRPGPGHVMDWPGADSLPLAQPVKWVWEPGKDVTPGLSQS